MATQKQIEANRKNAQKSTGPKTEEGKAKSSLNALQHGVLSGVAVARDEDATEYDFMLMSFCEEYDPRSMIEDVLVERLANLIWRERRLIQAEARLIDGVNEKADLFSILEFSRHLPLKDQLLVGRYQGMLGRQIRDTLSELAKEQERRRQCIEAMPQSSQCSEAEAASTPEGQDLI